MGEIELMSMIVLPRASPEATPSGLNNTFSTSGVSGTMMMMVSAASASDLRVSNLRARADFRRHRTLAVDEQLMPGLHQIVGHGPPHDAEADKTDLHGSSPIGGGWRISAQCYSCGTSLKPAGEKGLCGRR